MGLCGPGCQSIEGRTGHTVSNGSAHGFREVDLKQNEEEADSIWAQE